MSIYECTEGFIYVPTYLNIASKYVHNNWNLKAYVVSSSLQVYIYIIQKEESTYTLTLHFVKRTPAGE